MQAMVPSNRRVDLDKHTIPATARPAGVLILLYLHAGAWHLPLTRRTESVETHKGQISLPGGSQDAHETLPETALRETHEEIGIDPHSIHILGALSPLYLAHSNFCLQPFVGYTLTTPAFFLREAEVAELIQVPLAALLDPANVQAEEWSPPPRRVPFYRLGTHKVWGATAMILAEFIAALRRVESGQGVSK
jgi:8-oxo-dGTP pyrophosphatase MutT (NUDIX family)